MSYDDCHLVIDRDVLAAINIAKKGDDVFHCSKCLSGEAMVAESCLFPNVIYQVYQRKFEAYNLNRTEPYSVTNIYDLI